MNKSIPPIEEKRGYIQSLFSRIAARYDLMNRIISLGQDVLWRRRVVELLSPRQGQLYLDIGAGTGDLSRQILRIIPDCRVIAADLTMAMVIHGKQATGNPNVEWVVADAQALPFNQNTFQGTISGYLLRNVNNVDLTIREQVRVIQPGSRLVSLDTTPPERNCLYPIIYFYLRTIIPLVGWLITGERQAYEYLPESTCRHIPADKLADKLMQAGLEDVTFEKWMAGTMAIHSGKRKP